MKVLRKFSIIFFFGHRQWQILKKKLRGKVKENFLPESFIFPYTKKKLWQILKESLRKNERNFPARIFDFPAKNIFFKKKIMTDFERKCKEKWKKISCQNLSFFRPLKNFFWKNYDRFWKKVAGKNSCEILAIYVRIMKDFDWKKNSAQIRSKLPQGL